ncbi:MAG: murein biosynthesis integral membrane protein MurJ, partial [Pseudomonadota bacterium]
PLFVSILATGFRDDPGRFGLTVDYVKIMFPYLACMSVVGIYGGMLNALHRFAAAAAAPLLLNVCLITGLLLYADRPVEDIGQAAAIAVMTGGILQLLTLIYAASRSKLLLRLRLPRLTSSVTRMIKLGTPGFIAAGALQINLIVGTNVASRQLGANSWLAYADQLYQLPLAIIGIALGVVLMPAISRSVKSGDESGAVKTLSRGIEIALFFALPAAAALIVIPDRLCAALFQDLAGDVTRMIGAGGSAFNDTDVSQTGLALMLFGVGLPAFVLQKVLNAAFFAREDTKTPMKFALIGIALNAIISISLFPHIGFLSVPLGTICASWTEVTLLSITLGRKGFLSPGATFVSRTIRVVMTAIGLGGLLYLLRGEWDALRSLAFGQDWLLLLGVVGLSVAAYAVVAILIGAIKPREWQGGVSAS